jgi:hypothetical protein
MSAPKSASSRKRLSSLPAGILLSAVVACCFGCRHDDPLIQLPPAFRGDVDVDFCSLRHSENSLIEIDETGYGATGLCVEKTAKYSIVLDGKVFHPREPVEIQENEEGRVRNMHFVVP